MINSIIQPVVFLLAFISCIISIWMINGVQKPAVKKALYSLFSFSGAWSAVQLTLFFVDDPLIMYWLYTFGLGLGLVCVISWIYFCSAFSGKDYHTDHLLRVGVLFGVIGLLVTKFTNIIHSQYFNWSIELIDGQEQLIIDFTLMYFGNILGMYIISFLGLYMIVRMMYQTDLISFGPLLSFSMLFITPVIGEVVFSDSPLQIGLNFEPVGVAIFGLIITFVLKHPFGDVQPIARKELVDRLDEGIILFNNNDVVIDYNECAVNIIPTIAEERVTLDMITQVYPSLEKVDNEMVIIPIKIDDEKRMFLCSYQVLEVGPHSIGTALVFNDITELEQNRKEVFRHNKQWDHMAGAIAHELRNSLFLLTGYIEQANIHLENEEYDDVQESLDVVSDSSERIHGVIEDLQQFTKYSQTISEKSQVSLRDIVEIVSRNYPSLDVSLDSDAIIYVQPAQFEDLISNAFDFAVYAESDSVTITTTDNHIIIEDDGIYPSANYDEELFDYESAVPTSKAGMRLPMVQSISHAHGWSIDIDLSYEDGVRYKICNSVTERVNDTP